MSTTDPDFYDDYPRDPEREAAARAAADEYDRQEAAKYQALKAEMTAEIAAMTGEELSEAVDHAEEYRSEAQAEHGMGAISMGWRNGEFAPLHTPETDLFIRLGHERLRELYPPAPAPAPTVAQDDDLPF